MARKHKPKAGTRKVISNLRRPVKCRKMAKPGPDGKPRYYLEFVTTPGVIDKEEPPQDFGKSAS